MATVKIKELNITTNKYVQNTGYTTYSCNNLTLNQVIKLRNYLYELYNTVSMEFVELPNLYTNSTMCSGFIYVK